MASILAVALAAAAPAAKADPPAGGAQAAAQPTPASDYLLREEMIPMRDGVRLHTLIIIPKAAREAPILLTRTPFQVAGRLMRPGATQLAKLLGPADAPFAADGYIRVFQEVRGRSPSQGIYVVARPPRGPLNAGATDHATDAFDTIDWLVKNLPQSNGRVGMIGASYDGFTVAMALLDPHPALKAAVAENPMIDGWMGDDWFHHGAFRQTTFDFLAAVARDESLPRKDIDDYEAFLRAGSAGDMAKSADLADHPFWRQLVEHPAYDATWRDQALDRLLAARPLTVPTLWVGGLWDQEDSYGAVHAYAALEAKDAGNDRNFLVLGPWRHNGMNGEGSALGPLRFDGDTARDFRERVLKPFLDERLRPRAPKAALPPVLAYQTGANQRRALQAWPPADAGAGRRLYLRAGGRLSSQPPDETTSVSDTYVSDPRRPVPYAARPVRNDDPEQWRGWLTADQRFADGRPDVLSYVSEPLTEPLTVSGAPRVNLYAATSGSDADWVVKLIDVYPDAVPDRSELGGYELMVSGDIFRGRYREGFDRPQPIASGKTELYRFALPQLNHVFLPGHRIMVQVQSSWFPLYDRNPQTFVGNIFSAKPGDYQQATQTISRAARAASSIDLPVAPAASRRKD